MRFKCDSLDTPHTQFIVEALWHCGAFRPGGARKIQNKCANHRKQNMALVLFRPALLSFFYFLCYFVAQNVTEFKHAL